MTAIPFKVIQGHQFWYRLRAYTKLPISESHELTSHIAHFSRYRKYRVGQKNRPPILNQLPCLNVNLKVKITVRSKTKIISYKST